MLWDSFKYCHMFYALDSYESYPIKLSATELLTYGDKMGNQ